MLLDSADDQPGSLCIGVFPIHLGAYQEYKEDKMNCLWYLDDIQQDTQGSCYHGPYFHCMYQYHTLCTFLCLTTPKHHYRILYYIVCSLFLFADLYLRCTFPLYMHHTVHFYLAVDFRPRHQYKMLRQQPPTFQSSVLVCTLCSHLPCFRHLF